MKQEYAYVEISDNFTKDMRKKRLKMGITQKELAKSVGVSAKTIQNYENGQTMPNVELMKKISMELSLLIKFEVDESIDVKWRLVK